ncbi:MAG: cytochrome c3 family protein [Bdellovibrionia bacterium]
MSQIFKRQSNSILQASLLGIVGIAVALGIFWTAIKWSDWETEVNIPIGQPVQFSHQHHVGGLGIDCRYCHTSVTKSPYAGIPPTHTCMTCHSQIWQGSPLLEPVRQSFARYKPLEWNRVHRLPKFVYFNHSIHVNKVIGCTSCHGPIQTMPLTWQANSFYMRDCLTCHREPEKYIRPQSEVFNVYWTAPTNQQELGSELVRKYHIPKERLTDCYTCHR